MMASDRFDKFFHKTEANPYQKLFTNNADGTSASEGQPQKISRSIHVDRIYDALDKDDPAEVVITTMDVLSKTEIFDFNTQKKSEEVSNLHRKEGNQFYSVQRFRKALECYNKALLYAPDNSQAMKLAYSNRSALLFTIKAFTACNNDIDKFFSMGCTDYKLAQRLRQRKKECLMNAWIENMTDASPFVKDYFKFNVKHHPDIPSAIVDIDVVLESGPPKVVAAKDIPIGKLVAVETPFVGELDLENYYICCHYCHKHSLNLIPCEGCCVALFCDDECKNKCKKEYHNIECKIIDYPNRYTVGAATTMNLRAALKMRQMCKSWKELIAASYNIGEDRMRNSSVSDIYDVNSKFSLLSHNNESHFLYGERYNQSFVCGMDLLALANLPSFFPKDADERDAAIRAFARIILHLYSSYRKVEVYNAAQDVNSDILTTNTEKNYGLFSFTGKLKHECDANLIILGVKSKAALVAVRPIKKGDELTISLLGHYYENMLPNRQYRLFCFTQEICRCRVCLEDWGSMYLKNLKLSSDKVKLYEQWTAEIKNWEEKKGDERVFKATCKCLTEIQGAECTKAHHDVFREFRKLTTFCQYAATKNEFIQKDDEMISVKLN